MSVFVIKDTGDMKGLFAARPFLKDNVIYELDGQTFLAPTQTSIKIADYIHIEDKYGKFINHSCYPSVKIEAGELIALRDIKTGDEITFNYLENEDELVVPFICNCCNKLIS